MLRFEYTEHLYALALLPVLLLFFWLAWRSRQRAIRRFGESNLMERLMPEVSRYKHYLKFGLLLLALALLAIGWANPQYGAKLVKYKRKSVDVFVAFDISQSMLAEDISPNRLARASRFAQNLVEGLQSERLGLILFAGSAYVQSPITQDINSILLSLRSANPSMIPNQGTAIAEAIGLAEKSFDENNKSHRALIIITDGEDHEEDAEDVERHPPTVVAGLDAQHRQYDQVAEHESHDAGEADPVVVEHGGQRDVAHRADEGEERRHGADRGLGDDLGGAWIARAPTGSRGTSPRSPSAA